MTEAGEPVGHKLSDGSHRFVFKGGPYDGMTFRLYPPFGPSRRPAFGRYGETLYVPEPPKRGSKWTYVFQGEVNPS